MQVAAAPVLFRGDAAGNEQARRAGSNLRVRGGERNGAVLEAGKRAAGSHFQAQKIADRSRGGSAGQVGASPIEDALQEDGGAVLDAVIVIQAGAGSPLKLIGGNVQAVLLDGPVSTDDSVGARGVVVGGVEVAGYGNVAGDIGHGLRAIGRESPANGVRKSAVGKRELGGGKTGGAERTGICRGGLRQAGAINERTEIRVAGSTYAAAQAICHQDVIHG